ncbi:MAG: hypothetical protein AB1439_01615 [candidate division FCPU426 bacterium]
MRKPLAALGCLLGIAILAAGCATRGPLASLRPQPGKALVVGRVEVYYNQKLRNEQVELRFKQLTRVAKDNTFYYGPGEAGPNIPQPYGLDASGLLVLALEPGEWILERILCHLGENRGDMLYAFYRENPVFNLPQAGKVYYLGDLNIRWQGPETKDWDLFRTLDPTARPVNDGELQLEISEDAEGLRTELNRRYGAVPEWEHAVPAIQTSVAPAGNTVPAQTVPDSQ